MWPTHFSSHILKNFEKHWSQRLFKESYEFKVFGGTNLTVLFHKEKIEGTSERNIGVKFNLSSLQR